jgi:hypothetical protein
MRVESTRVDDREYLALLNLEDEFFFLELQWTLVLTRKISGVCGRENLSRIREGSTLNECSVESGGYLIRNIRSQSVR